MTLVVFSYRANYARYCGRGCHCLHAQNSSDFATHSAETLEEMADWLAKRILEDREASYLNLVFRGWGEVTEGGAGWSQSECGDEASIFFPTLNEWNHDEDYEETEARNKETDGMESQLRTMVKERLAGAVRARKAIEARAKADQAAAAAKKKEEEEKAELERLKNKYPEKGT